ncbi:MAG: type II secretion system protein GspC [Desulfobacterales bacterium]|jgi:general secretion pathway protein C
MVNRYFSIANILLITAGIYLCVNAFYTLVTARLDYRVVSTPTEPSQDATPPVKQSQPPMADYKRIVARNIFNSSTEAAAAPLQAKKVDIEKLKETDLKLKLWGTVTGQNGQTYAVIEDTKAREQNLYRAGDSIQKAIVKLILREKVVLSVDDRDEILAMEEIMGRQRGSRPPIRSSSSAASTAPAKMPVSRYPRKITLQGEQIEKALENLGDLMEQATFRPHVEDGQPAGITISGIKPNAIFRKMRLRNGDIITGINDSSIQSVEDAVKVFEDLSSGSSIKLQIKRRGREQTLDYSIE